MRITDFSLTGKIREDTPASEGGLREGDRIIEINGENIDQAYEGLKLSKHKFVMNKIKSIPGEVKILVLDAEADKYYRDRNITVTSDLPHVVKIECPATRPSGEKI